MDTAMFAYAVWVALGAVVAGWLMLVFLHGAREVRVSHHTIEDGWIVRHEDAP